MKKLFYVCLVSAPIMLYAQNRSKVDEVIEEPVVNLSAATNHSNTTANDTAVFAFVEHMASFPGGDAALMQFLAQNIQWPAIDRDVDISGKVLLRFIVEKDGSITNIVILRKLEPNFDAEAIRVIKLMPKFKPATQQGKPVRTYFNLPVAFGLH